MIWPNIFIAEAVGLSSTDFQMKPITSGGGFPFLLTNSSGPGMLQIKLLYLRTRTKILELNTSCLHSHLNLALAISSVFCFSL